MHLLAVACYLKHEVLSFSFNSVLSKVYITGFAAGGIFTPNGHVRLINSQVIDNATDPSCEGTCVDIVSPVAPRLKGTASCGTSLRYLADTSWGVCIND